MQSACTDKSWVQGFSNKNLAFVSNQTVCYPCGNYILFLDIKTKKTRAVQCQAGQVGAFAANANSQVVAFSDRKLNPLIYIYTFPELRKLTELKGDAQLDYTLLAFSFKGPYLASYSSIPEFVLSVWNWQENLLLCSESQPGLTGTALSFNPMNWQQLCFVSESSVTIWHVERSKDKHHLTRHPVELPDDHGAMSPHEDLFFPASRNYDPYYGPDLPVSAIAGLKGHEAETFVQKAPPEFMQKIADVVSHARSEVQKKKGGKPSSLQKPVLLAMAFCNEGLYAAGSEGILMFYHIKDLQYEIKICADISQPISSLLFSPDYTSLLLVTDQGTVYSYRPAHSGEAVKLLDTSSSCFLAADFLTPGNNYCVSVTISGEVQVWSLEDGTFLSKLNLGIEATSMACCPSSNSVAVGTQTGQICFLDVTKAEVPRVVHRTFLSKLPVLSLHYDQSGQFLIARATEGHIFILDARPSKLFQVLGYIDNDKYVNEQGMFNASDLKKEQYDLDYPLSSAVRLKSHNIVYGYCTCAPFIRKYYLSAKNKWDSPSVFSSEKKIPSKQFGSGLLCLSPNSQWLAAAARDGVLFIYNTSTLVTEEDGNITNTDDMTWIGQKIQKVMREETQRFANQKEELQMGIKKLRETIQKMMHENEKVPDIEKLEHWEFNLDLKEQEQVQAEAEENVARCFHMDCEVRNYPLKERSKEELETLKKVLQLKQAETADLQAQKKNLDSDTALSEEENEKAAGELTVDGASLCLNGSLSSQYGGDTSILYHQCDLHTKEQKLNQTILLKDVIYQVKTAFNEEFDIVVQKKEQEIARVKERNLKIREILEQLELQVEVWEPVLTDDEMPERALTVQDSEIKAEKYMTQEEKEQAELLAKLEMERRLAATDDERVRALDDMMGGVLEIRREDVLKMVRYVSAMSFRKPVGSSGNVKFNQQKSPISVTKESWRTAELHYDQRDSTREHTQKQTTRFYCLPEDLWTEEESKVFEEYEKKVNELNEEKEEYRQFLRNEWNKLEASIKETTQNFDDIVCKLSEKKLKSQMVIYQEELKIVNLIYALLLDEELDTREAGLHKFLMKKKKEKVKGVRKILTTKYGVEAYRGPYTDALQEEKSLEHGFMKQFAHIPGNLFEELLQLYKRRPETSRTETLLDTANPYVKGSPEDYQDALSHLMKAMDELDSPEHMPSGLDQSLWKHFCLARRNKMEIEELVKWKALALAEMQACLQRRTDENDKMKSELESIFQELIWLKEEKMKLQQNLTVQFLLKQGQVELGSTQIPEYSDAILIDRRVVEELNCALAAQGEKKITAMVEFKDFSKGIIQLEWEHKKMKMQIQDLKEKARDIVILPISKDCQLLHKKNVKKHQKKVRELKKCIHLKEQENYELSLQLKEMLVSVSERKHIFEAADTRDISEKITRQRYQEILKQKHLRNLIREQEKQLAILQSEIESCNPRTLHII
ncbi:Cilia- and flagella-associated protein 43 [Lonchura striata]|uniref:Cilia- and flagella-associated protein 43 n=1 Tax=Lonchura striata TaxID=40157 RepID=A0A218V9E7_9PASE|nr:Cilia- and flagella-associated protein 43 [Lonchura striata domestica]